MHVSVVVPGFCGHCDCGFVCLFVLMHLKVFFKPSLGNCMISLDFYGAGDTEERGTEGTRRWTARGDGFA